MKKSSKKKQRNKRNQLSGSNNGVRRPEVRWADLDRSEQISVVCNLFCRGLQVSKIAEHISNNYSTSFGRESTYPVLMEAARRGWIRYVPPPVFVLESRLKRQFDWLEDAKVVHTTRFEDVAFHGAEMLIDLLKNFRRQNRDEVHIGFAGGHAMRKLAQTFAKLVNQSSDKIPPTLVFHAIVAGFNVHDPTTDPNTFFTLFQSSASIDTNFRFVGLHAPPVVRWDQFETLKNSEGVIESYQSAREIDIVITSATNWLDEDSTFRKYMKKSENCFDLLQSSNCIGDILWLPLGPIEPVKTKTTIRAMTLVELSQLPAFIKNGKYVILVIGPCSICNRSKAEILAAVLNQRNKLITHVVADSRSVREMFG